MDKNSISDPSCGGSDGKIQRRNPDFRKMDLRRAYIVSFRQIQRQRVDSSTGSLTLNLRDRLRDVFSSKGPEMWLKRRVISRRTRINERQTLGQGPHSGWGSWVNTPRRGLYSRLSSRG